MSTLLIPVAPLSRTKSRLRDCFSIEKLKEFTLAMFKDLSETLTKVNCFEYIITYCESSEILELAENYGIVGIKEALTEPCKPFDDIITEFEKKVLDKYPVDQTVLGFLDLILITPRNFIEFNDLLKKNQLVMCPAIYSAGVSILGKNPPDIIQSSFSDPIMPSLVAFHTKASEKGLDKIAIYDSFRAGYDVDIKQDLVFAYEYLKMFNLTHTEVFKFLKNNLKLTIKKKNANNNRTFEIFEKK
ncbi:hypothetical protein LCGC14_1598750 [marine sediment metagenome]|uniref:2-phospho-L-lactate guanylyltransferase n=1 Tax=marine sediment metagenome TaxID=412755 RepID=A0A0F9IBS5_9ZZZZ|nr:MAG: 2-phospho-L-lactate guanylyltransferase [Candidatus Lokiarchaeum sp. GC14_75]